MTTVGITGTDDDHVSAQPWHKETSMPILLRTSIKESIKDHFFTQVMFREEGDKKLKDPRNTHDNHIHPIRILDNVILRSCENQCSS